MMKYLSLILFLAIVLSCGFTLPEHKGPTDFDRQTINHFKKNGRGGIITAFLGDSSLRSNMLQSSYWMTEKEEFKGKYFIGNYNEQPETFTLFCLLDYRQIPFSFNNKIGLTHKLVLNKGQEIEVPIHLGILPKGAHDLIIAAVAIFEEDSILSYVQPHRANVFVESKSFPKTAQLTVLTKSTQTENTLFQIRRSDNAGLSKQTFLINVNNQLEESVSSVILLFNNFKQVEHGDLFLRLDSKHETDLTVKVTSLTKMIFGLKINNPYTYLEPEPKVLSTADKSIDMSNVILK